MTALVLNKDISSAEFSREREHWLNFAQERCEGVAAFFVLHAAGEDLTSREFSHVGHAMFEGQIVQNGNSSFIVGMQRELR